MKLTAEEKIGQLFLVGITHKDNIEDVIDLIKKYHIGGVLLYKNNYETYDEMIGLINSLKLANKDNKIPLFISIDQENGKVNRFPKEFKLIKNAYQQSFLDVVGVKEVGKITANMLHSSGINMNFGPVLDLKTFDNDHYIGSRAFSSDPQKVYEISNIIASEYKKTNVIPVLKHFPGQGSIKKDSHLFLPVINSYHDKEDIIPFELAIKSGADAVMIGHILIKKKTNNLPASISKSFIKEIREKYNYENLIVSDELAMRSVRYIYGKKKSISLAFNAGVDVVMYKYFKKMEYYINDLIYKYKNGKMDNEEIERSVTRVLFMKKKYKVNDKEVKNDIDIDLINSKIENINKKMNKVSNL